MEKRYNLSETVFIIFSFAVEAMLYELMSFPSPGLVTPVFHHALPVYRQCKEFSENDRLIHTLLAVMQSCEDSTIVYRHSVEVLHEVQKKAETQ